MRERTIFILLAVAVLAAVALTILYRGNRTLGAGSGTPRRVVVVLKSVDYTRIPFWRSVRDGAMSAAQDFNVTVSLRGPKIERDVQGQMAIVREAMEEKPDAIVLAAADYNLLVPLAAEIRRRGIILACIDSFIHSDDANVRIGTDSYEGGQKCAAALMRYVNPGETVAVMSYVKGSSTAIDRESGARDSLWNKVRLLDTQYSDSDADTAYLEASRLISLIPELRGIVALNEPTAAGAARALDKSGKAGTIALIAFDNSFSVLKYVERGIIRDTIVQKPFNMGYLGVKVARELIGGARPQPFINTGSIDISRANMFQPENQKLLFPVSEEP
jgi:ribose transport system substrate-binding protein